MIFGHLCSDADGVICCSLGCNGHGFPSVSLGALRHVATDGMAVIGEIECRFSVVLCDGSSNSKWTNLFYSTAVNHA